jgi:hypothetical protein
MYFSSDDVIEPSIRQGSQQASRQSADWLETTSYGESICRKFDKAGGVSSNPDGVTQAALRSKAARIIRRHRPNASWMNRVMSEADARTDHLCAVGDFHDVFVETIC